MRCLAVLLLAALGAACVPAVPAPAVDPERADCEAGVASMKRTLGARVLTSVECRPVVAAVPARGVYLGYVGTDTAVVYFGGFVGNQSTIYYELIAAHEAGHAWDLKRMTATKRARFAQIMGTTWDRELYADTWMRAIYDTDWSPYGFSPLLPGQRDEVCWEVVPC